MSSFQCPRFNSMEQSLVSDFLASVDESNEEIEACVEHLIQQPADLDEINRLFRSMHSLKGNCRMVFLEPLVDLYHQLEEIIDDLRNSRYEFLTELGEFVLTVLESGRGLIRQVAETGTGDESLRNALLAAVSNVHSAEDAQRRDICLQAVADLRGETPGAAELALLPELPADLLLMREWSNLLDNLSIYRKGRSAQAMTLCRFLNTELGGQIAEDQLEAAVSLHDFGMCLVAPAIVNKVGSLDREELRQVQQHVHVGSRLLQRFGAWDEAALMVLQHHEHFDGGGYPARLSGEQIHIGARIIAVADAFCALTNERSDRNYKKTLFGAVKEINGNSGSQFDPQVVEAFNNVIRLHYLSGPASA